jgi:iron complex transport system substrate-binding protein
LAPSNTEILFAIGAGKQVVGRDDVSDYPPEVDALPSVGGLDNFNAEQLVALKPDLILLAEITNAEQVKKIEDLGFTVTYLLNPKTIEDMYINLQIVASLTGHNKEAIALVETFKTRVAAVDEKLKTVTTKPVVFYELDATDPAKPYTIGPNTFVDQLIVRAGGLNLTTVSGVTDPYPQLSVEQIVSVNPDMIILGDSMWGVTAESVGERPGWENLKAVTSQAVFPFDDNLISRPGPRLVDGLEALAKLLHPELYK